MDRTSHLEDQWPMDDGFMVDDGVFMCGDGMVLIGDEIDAFWMEIG